MHTLAEPAVQTHRPPVDRPRARPSAVRYLVASGVVVVGLVVGLTVGLVSFRHAQDRIEGFDRVAIPGAMTVDVERPGGRVAYYEGEENVVFADLDLSITAPDGSTVEVSRYEGEMLYETRDLVRGRAVATFHAPTAGEYAIEVGGVDTGTLVVGESVARRALPGILIGLGIATVAVFAGFVLWLVTFIERKERTSSSQGN